ncbi:MAG TPA: glycosyltransferase family 1 protein [Candidatus Saccharimonadales bacterium]|nr:glycosyltransferase family 1 protein [Candidatus Saccharimonadales bacterium]
MTNRRSKPIHILFDASPLLVNKTGVAYYTEQLVTELAKHYPDQLELTGFYYNFLGRRRTAFPKAPNLHWHGVHLLPSKVVYQLRRWGIEMPVELLAGRRGDFVLFPNFLSYPSLHKTPSAPVIHDLTYLEMPQYVSPKNGSDLRRFTPKAIRRASFVITVSEVAKHAISKQYAVPLKNILVTPIPVSERHELPQKKCLSLLEANNLTKPFILFVGTIDPRKNIIGLINGYCALPKELRSRYSLVLVGRIERFAAAEAAKIEEAKAAGFDVIHLGYVAEEVKQALYQSATMFAHAALHEGFGMPVLEAMSHGLPCVISDIPVFREVAGDAALYFDYQEPASVAKALASILEDPKTAQRLSTASKKRAASFTWQRVAADVYQQICAHLAQESPGD